MRVKDLERTVNVAWSPASHHPILLAAGTAAQQLDASFNTTAALELFSLSLSEPGADMEKVAATTTEQRYDVTWQFTRFTLCSSVKISLLNTPLLLIFTLFSQVSSSGMGHRLGGEWYHHWRVWRRHHTGVQCLQNVGPARSSSSTQRWT